MKSSDIRRLAYTALVMFMLTVVVFTVTWATNAQSRSTQTVAAEAQSTLVPVSTPKWQPTTTPNMTPNLQPLINVTRAQYEEAHARWLSKRIDTYQISVHHVSMRVCSPDVIVSDNGKNLQPIGEYAGLGPCASVESLFEMVDRRLDAIK